MRPKDLLLFVAVIPLAFGLNLQTGQNWFSIHGLDETGAAFLGLAMELLSFGLVFVSSRVPFKIGIAVAFVIQAPLVIFWGMIVGMFSGVGDGAARGAGILNVLPWFLSGLIYASLGIQTLTSIAKARRAKTIAASGQAAP